MISLIKQQESSFQEIDTSDMDEVDKDKTEHIKTEQNTNVSRIAGIYAGPAVRKLAREFGIDLNKVSASGPRNRILKEDLHRFVKSNLGKSQLDIPEIPTIDFSQFGDIEEIDFTKFQKTSTESSAIMDNHHVTQHDVTDVTNY